MSEAACAKEIICDPDINKAQAVANVLEYLGEQVALNYDVDPEKAIVMKNAVSEAVTPHLAKAVQAGVGALDKFSGAITETTE